MLLSIITVCFNSENTIDRSLNSVNINEDWLEHIIVDGKSSDLTKIKIKNHLANHTKQNIVFVSEKDEGIFDAYNKGISLAKGKYIIFLNSDDALKIGALKEIKDYLQSNDPEAISFGDIEFKSKFSNEILKSKYKFFTFLFFGMTLQHPSGIFPSRVLQQHQFDKNFKVIGDYDQLLRSILAGEKISFHNILTHDMYAGGVSDGAYFIRLKECFICHRKNLGIFVAASTLITRCIIFLVKNLINIFIKK